MILKFENLTNQICSNPRYNVKFVCWKYNLLFISNENKKSGYGGGMCIGGKSAHNAYIVNVPDVSKPSVLDIPTTGFANSATKINEKNPIRPNQIISSLIKNVK